MSTVGSGLVVDNRRVCDIFRFFWLICPCSVGTALLWILCLAHLLVAGCLRGSLVVLLEHESDYPLGVSVCYLLAYSLLHSFFKSTSNYLSHKLMIGARRRLTRKLQVVYLDPSRRAYLQTSKSWDSRIHSDLVFALEMWFEFWMGGISKTEMGAIYQVTAFGVATYWLHNIINEIYPPALPVLLTMPAFFVVCATLLFWASRPTGRLQMSQLDLEDDFRLKHFLVAENAETISLYQAELSEYEACEALKFQVTQNARKLVKTKFVFDMVQIMSQNLNFVLSLFTATVILLMATRAGVIKAGTLGKWASLQFGFEQAMTPLLEIFENFMVLFRGLAAMSRVVQTWDDLTPEPNSGQREETLGLLRVNQSVDIQETPEVIFKDVQVKTPAGQPILRDLNFQVNHGESLLIVGPSGSGKSSILRALAGLWPVDSTPSSQICRPARFLYLSRNVYFVPGSLRRNLAYPLWDPRLETQLSDDKVKALLMATNLSSLWEDHCHRLDEIQELSSIFSFGEAQRLGFARLFWHYEFLVQTQDAEVPFLGLLDDCTSGMDLQSELICFTSLHAYGMTTISVGHSRFEGFHSQKLVVDGDTASLAACMQAPLFMEAQSLETGPCHDARPSAVLSPGLTTQLAEFPLTWACNLDIHQIFRAVFIRQNLVFLWVFPLVAMAGLIDGSYPWIQGKFEDAFQDGSDWTSLIKWTLMIFLLQLVNSKFSAMSNFCSYSLLINWRDSLISRLHRLYFGRATKPYYFLGTFLQSPGDRITIDTDLFTRNAVDFFTGGIYRIENGLVYVTCVLIIGCAYGWSEAETLGTGNGPILFIIILAVILCIIFPNYLVSAQAVSAVEELQKREAVFREGHMRIRVHGEVIGFHGGESSELHLLDICLDEVLEQFEKVARARYLLSFVQLATTNFDFLSILVSLIFAKLVRAPQTAPFRRVAQTCMERVNTLIFQFTDFANAFASGSRLSELLTTMKRLEAVESSWVASDHLEFQKVTLAVPGTSRILFENLSFALDSQESLLVFGPSGSGKSSIFRAISGLWAFEGVIIKPKRCFFLPQKSYMGEKTLRRIIGYPIWSPELLDDLSPAKVQDLLSETGCAHLLKGLDLDQEKDWTSLSEGEQQALQFARFLWHAENSAEPLYGLLDESTAAMDPERVKLCYSALKRRKLTYLTISHSPLLFAYHDRIMSIEGPSSGPRQVNFQSSAQKTTEMGDFLNKLRFD